MKFYVKRYASN